MWDAPSVLVGLVGAGIQASRTPALHEREGAALGLRYIYKLIDLESLGLHANALPDILAAAQRLGFSGLNVTHPCKQSIIPLLDALSPDAANLGAVNTVVLTDGRRVGHNTDWWGFAESFRRDLPDVRRDRVVQFGAGGAGAAVAHALLTLGVGEVVIIDTDSGRARNLVEALRGRFSRARASTDVSVVEALRAADGLVNTTPLGMTKHPGMALSADLLRPDLWVADIVYFPLETELLRVARARGCRTMSGGGMAVFQAVGAFRLFTGREPDADRMLAHFRDM
ncbi:shikimate dehydrogenase [Microvirga pudoricolor]|uniref:shikimate dehydrogenase n=1 Tax=Microvirga pudoricolor TaxID=2778729 RepID=UPI0019525F06|nr:shikimate dehydrogenase [Microvirga pudoricolor]MBM6593142.1 shikimate dehydrogenase [Microvirga pudoricolor]